MSVSLGKGGKTEFVNYFSWEGRLRLSILKIREKKTSIFTLSWLSSFPATCCIRNWNRRKKKKKLRKSMTHGKLNIRTETLATAYTWFAVPFFFFFQQIMRRRNSHWSLSNKFSKFLSIYEKLFFLFTYATFRSMKTFLDKKKYEK